MFIVGMLSWWYTTGWRQQLGAFRQRLAGIIDFFSISLLFKTLFSPYRQISAGRVRGPIGVQLRAFFDRLVSRLIGAMIRSVVIVVGCIAIICSGIFGLLFVLLWAAVPGLPLVGLVLMLTGWMPWR